MVFPVCTPLAVDPGHPFPHISNLSLNLAVELQDPDGAAALRPREGAQRAAAPGARCRRAPPRTERRAAAAVYVWLEQMLAAHLDALFPQMHLVESHPFRVIRDADMEIQEMEADDLLETRGAEPVPAALRLDRGAVRRTRACPTHLRALLAENLEIGPRTTSTRCRGPLGLSDLIELTRLDRPDLKDPPFTPRVPPALRARRRHLLRHPAGRYPAAPPVRLVQPGGRFHPQPPPRDPNVLAIKQTLYRVGSNSPIVEALLEAARDTASRWRCWWS